MLEMNPQVRAMWTAALRSGEYTQGVGGLRNNADEFCCLGVLCDLAVKNGAYVTVTADDEMNGFTYGGEIGFLPSLVREWAGLSERDPVLVPAEDNPEHDGDLHAAQLNDEGKTFAEIADLIDGGVT